MSGDGKWRVSFDFLGTRVDGWLVAGRYAHGGRVAVQVQHVDEFGDESVWATVTVNVPAAVLADPDYDVIVNYGASAEVVRAVVESGFVEPEPYMEVQVGMTTSPVYHMSDEAKAWFDANVEE